MKIRFIAAGTILVGAAVGILAFSSYHKTQLPSDKDQAIVTLVGQILKQGHYDPKNVDDHFSREVFNKYMNYLDGEKKFFLQSDVDKLDKYSTQIDDEINGTAPMDFQGVADSIFSLRMQDAAKLYPGILAKPFDFNKQESFQVNRDKAPYPADEAAMKEVWRKMLKYQTLVRLTDLEDTRAKAKDTAAIKKESDAQLEQEARGKVKKMYDRAFDRMRTGMDKDQRFSQFVNAITSTMDPHTDYMLPTDKRTFDEQMSGVFYGIGALLSQPDREGRIKIDEIVSGGPAWKEGELKVGDIIQKVGEEKTDPVDLTGFITEDAVKLIRGAKGVPVKLTVKQIDGTVKTITIVRGEVKIDQTFARSYIINNDNHKIGLIYLPEFYFNQKGVPGPGSSAYDVGKQIEKLKAQQVEGIILDLRFNGGGSLGDAIDIAGLFVPQGPVVQVRSRNGEVNVLNDRNKSVAYDGPLAIMVNEYSASASEILSAAMQDYKRAVIVGSQSTYGKGTVQRMFDLNEFLSPSARNKFGDLGSVKLTIQKFYRINGGSTQLKGVTPDIILPDPYFDVAERKDSDALKWDQIEKANYTAWQNPVDVDYLKKNSETRVAGNEAFKIIDENIVAVKKIEDEKEIPLNITAYKGLQKKNDSAQSRLDKLKTVLPKLSVNNVAQDMTMISKDSIQTKTNRSFLDSYRKDAYLDETVNVVNDMLNRQHLRRDLGKAKE